MPDLREKLEDKPWQHEIKHQPIGVVEETFEISGRGLILCLKFAFEKYHLSIDDDIKLVTPIGEEFLSRICGIGIGIQDILIENKYSKKDIPIGT